MADRCRDSNISSDLNTLSIRPWQASQLSCKLRFDPAAFPLQPFFE